jgi:hypothetical protein
MECMYQFKRQYLLPCCHIFHLNTQQTVLTTEKWREYLGLFEHIGMEVYETTGTVLVAQDVERGPDRVRVHSLPHLRGVWSCNFNNSMPSMRSFERVGVLEGGGETSNCRFI